MEPWELTHDEYMAAINNPDRGSATVGTRRDPFESVADAAQKKLWARAWPDIETLQMIPAPHTHEVRPEISGLLDCPGCMDELEQHEANIRLEALNKSIQGVPDAH